MGWNKLKHAVTEDEAKRVIKTNDNDSKKFYRVKSSKVDDTMH